jgi:hypothetical protein
MSRYSPLGSRAWRAQWWQSAADCSLVAVTGALVGGAVGMRLSGWARHLDFGANQTLTDAWRYEDDEFPGLGDSGPGASCADCSANASFG